MNPELLQVLVFISLLFQSGFVLINLLGLPGNVAVLFIPLIWALTGHIGWEVFGVVVALIAAGELAELAASYLVGRKYGVSNKSFVASVIGSIIGGIFGAGFFFGIGAVPGTFIGAFLGTFLYEFNKYRDIKTALSRGLATFLGRFAGTALKVVLGFIAVFKTWQGFGF
jgi:uncharacterized protein YqgC (DUF456 family)